MRFPRLYLISLSLICGVLRGQATYNGQPVVANQVIVRLKDTSPATLAAFQAATRSGEQVQTLSRTLALNLLRSSSRNVDSLVSTFKTNASVSYVEPNYIVRGTTVPNDGSYSQ